MNPVRNKVKKTVSGSSPNPSPEAISSGRRPVAITPRLSEKAYALSELHNTYIFDVPSDANRHSVARTIESQYEVGVTGVRIASVPGKTGRTIRRGRVVGQSKRSDIRKAYVTLKEGDKLPLFATETDAKPAKEAK